MARARSGRPVRAVPRLLTRRGWWTALVSAALLPSGRLFGVHELYGLGVAGLVLVVGAILWTTCSRWQVGVARHLQLPRLGAGEHPSVTLEVHNRLLRPTPVLCLRDPLGDGRHTEEVRLPPVGAGRSVTHSYRLPPVARGVHHLGPLTGAAVDPFGFAARRRALAPAERFVVHPPITRLRRGVGSNGLARPGGAASFRPGADNDEFASLREFRIGDDLRKVHWASSARRGVLLVREEERAHRGRVVVLVDLRAATWSPPAFETALEGAASVAADVLPHVEVRLLTTSGVDTGFGKGTRHRARLLDELALAETHPSADLVIAGGQRRPGAALGGLTVDDAAVVITSERVPRDQLRRLQELAHPASTTLVLVEADRRGDRPRRRAGAPAPAAGTSPRMVRVPLGASFAAAWDEAEGPA
ncbi:MAG TPA: DUF58 domain-containing protein [Acidimicrobiales bacterium]|nr:DUF58 domain-containing protein [Acidimicrobiales bacterium]